MAHAVHASLAGHPDNPPALAQRVGVTLLLKPDGCLTLVYSIHGPTRLMRIPTAADPAPADALWQTTCCELFVAHGATGYREFNFSPSGQWAVYDFGAYRKPLEIPLPCPAPMLESRREARRPTTMAHGHPQQMEHPRHGCSTLSLTATLSAAALPAGDILPCALAVIVEAHDGRRGYWALAHPPGRPDFHHRAGFALCLDKAGACA